MFIIERGEASGYIMDFEKLMHHTEALMQNACAVIRCLMSVALLGLAANPGPSAAQDTVPADRAPDLVPFGVYLSWERTAACADYYGIDRWEDVRKRLDAVAANHVDTLWVTNMAEADLRQLIQECEKRDIQLIPSMSSIEGKISWRWHNDGQYYDKIIPRVVNLAGNSATLVGWVLSDEPSKEMLPKMEELRQRFRKVDPNRFCLVVSMWPQTPHVPKETNLPVVCVDLYPFFGPRDPNGPHTDVASRHFFRRNALRMVEAIGEKDVAPWIMPMCFSDIWGPRQYDEQGHLIALPGSYMHWRCPTLAEIRWQIWETIRSGCRGVLFYTLAPEAPNPETTSLPPPDIAKENKRIVLAKAPTDLGPNALTNPDGSATPQLQEVGRVYRLLRPHKKLIRRWKRSEKLQVHVESPLNIQCFTDPTTDNSFAVVVNDDFHKAVAAKILVPPATTRLVDIVHDEEIELQEVAQADSHSGSLMLAAGAGTIVVIESVR
jgi:hypothetical protein